METIRIISGCLVLIATAVAVISYICFRIAFYVPDKSRECHEEFPIPEGEVYEPHRDTMIAWMKEVRAMPREDMTVTSFDGLTLHGSYYECCPGAPIELMFHGYRGNADRDLCGGVQRCFALKHNALIVDQRASGRSGGRVITFGVNESRDCETWLKFMLTRFGPDVKIILTGISMGAATVSMAAGRELPGNVIGVLADCGYTCAKEIICKTIGEMKLPPKLSYPFVKLGAKLYGKFDLEAYSPIQAMETCTVPIILFHGEDDAYVPCHMSRRNFEACKASKKQLITVPGAGHGLSYVIQPEAYLQALRDFFGQ